MDVTFVLVLIQAPTALLIHSLSPYPAPKGWMVVPFLSTEALCIHNHHLSKIYD